MHDVQVDPRNMFLGALLALVLLASAAFALTPTASANREECPAGRLCLWSGPTFGEARAFFNESETGCHSLANIDPRSGWNRTGHTATFPFIKTIPSGGEFRNEFPWGGEVCIQ